jgi:hypothetical protein
MEFACGKLRCQNPAVNAKVPGTKFLDKFLSRKMVPGTILSSLAPYLFNFFDFFDFAVNMGFIPAQGIGAVSFFATGKKDTSGKPGPCARGARMRPKQKKSMR